MELPTGGVAADEEDLDLPLGFAEEDSDAEDGGGDKVFPGRQQKRGTAASAPGAGASASAAGRTGGSAADDDVSEEEAGCAEADAFCDICKDGSWEKDNQILICEGTCKRAAHQTCYGVLSVPDDRWLCYSCAQSERAAAQGASKKGQPQASPAAPPICYICNREGGMMKPMKAPAGQLAHVVCALALDSVFFESTMRMDGIVVTDKDRLDKSRQFRCSLCGERGGATIKCRVPACQTTFHPSCAADNQQRLELHAHAQGFCSCDQVPFEGRWGASCSVHELWMVPPPRSDGYSEMDVFGLLDGLGVCNRENWAKRTRYFERKKAEIELAARFGINLGGDRQNRTLIPASTRGKMPGAAARGGDIEADDRHMEERRERGFSSGHTTVIAAAAQARFLMHEHEQVMGNVLHLAAAAAKQAAQPPAAAAAAAPAAAPVRVIKFKFGGAAQKEQASTSVSAPSTPGQPAGSKLERPPLSERILQDLEGHSSTISKFGGQPGAVPLNVNEQAADDGLGSTHLFGRAREHWKHIIQITRPVPAVPILQLLWEGPVNEIRAQSEGEYADLMQEVASSGISASAFDDEGGAGGGEGFASELGGLIPGQHDVDHDDDMLLGAGGGTPVSAVAKPTLASFDIRIVPKRKRSKMSSPTASASAFSAAAGAGSASPDNDADEADEHDEDEEADPSESMDAILRDVIRAPATILRARALPPPRKKGRRATSYASYVMNHGAPPLNVDVLYTEDDDDETELSTAATTAGAAASETVTVTVPARTATYHSANTAAPGQLSSSSPSALGGDDGAGGAVASSDGVVAAAGSVLSSAAGDGYFGASDLSILLARKAGAMSLSSQTAISAIQKRMGSALEGVVVPVPNPIRYVSHLGVPDHIAKAVAPPWDDGRHFAETTSAKLDTRKETDEIGGELWAAEAALAEAMAVTRPLYQRMKTAHDVSLARDAFHLRSELEQLYWFKLFAVLCGPCHKCGSAWINRCIHRSDAMERLLNRAQPVFKIGLHIAAQSAAAAAQGRPEQPIDCFLPPQIAVLTPAGDMLAPELPKAPLDAPPPSSAHQQQLPAQTLQCMAETWGPWLNRWCSHDYNQAYTFPVHMAPFIVAAVHALALRQKGLPERDVVAAPVSAPTAGGGSGQGMICGERISFPGCEDRIVHLCLRIRGVNPQKEVERQRIEKDRAERDRLLRQAQLDREKVAQERAAQHLAVAADRQSQVLQQQQQQLQKQQAAEAQARLLADQRAQQEAAAAKAAADQQARVQAQQQQQAALLAQQSHQQYQSLQVHASNSSHQPSSSSSSAAAAPGYRVPAQLQQPYYLQVQRNVKAQGSPVGPNRPYQDDMMACQQSRPYMERRLRWLNAQRSEALGVVADVIAEQSVNAQLNNARQQGGAELAEPARSAWTYIASFTASLQPHNPRLEPLKHPQGSMTSTPNAGTSQTAHFNGEDLSSRQKIEWTAPVPVERAAAVVKTVQQRDGSHSFGAPSDVGGSASLLSQTVAVQPPASAASLPPASLQSIAWRTVSEPGGAAGSAASAQCAGKPVLLLQQASSLARKQHLLSHGLLPAGFGSGLVPPSMEQAMLPHAEEVLREVCSAVEYMVARVEAKDIEDAEADAMLDAAEEIAEKAEEAEEEEGGQAAPVPLPPVDPGLSVQARARKHKFQSDLHGASADAATHHTPLFEQDTKDTTLASISDWVRVYYKRSAKEGRRAMVAGIDTAEMRKQVIVESLPAVPQRVAPKNKRGEELFCVCQQPHDDSRVFIACDACNGWFHVECVGLSRFATEYAVLSFACAECHAQHGRMTLVRDPSDPFLQDAWAAVGHAQLTTAQIDAFCGPKALGLLPHQQVVPPDEAIWRDITSTPIAPAPQPGPCGIKLRLRRFHHFNEGKEQKQAKAAAEKAAAAAAAAAATAGEGSASSSAAVQAYQHQLHLPAPQYILVRQPDASLVPPLPPPPSFSGAASGKKGQQHHMLAVQQYQQLQQQHYLSILSAHVKAPQWIIVEGRSAVDVAANNRTIHDKGGAGKAGQQQGQGQVGLVSLREGEVAVDARVTHGHKSAAAQYALPSAAASAAMRAHLQAGGSTAEAASSSASSSASSPRVAAAHPGQGPKAKSTSAAASRATATVPAASSSSPAGDDHAMILAQMHSSQVAGAAAAGGSKPPSRAGSPSRSAAGAGSRPQSPGTALAHSAAVQQGHTLPAGRHQVVPASPMSDVGQ